MNTDSDCFTFKGAGDLQSLFTVLHIVRLEAVGPHEVCAGPPTIFDLRNTSSERLKGCSDLFPHD